MATSEPRGFVYNQGEGAHFSLFGLPGIVKASSGDTGGSFYFSELELPPGFAPLRHTHLHEDEAFFLLEGRMRVFCGSDEWVLEPGGFVFLPRDIVHGFQVEGTSPARKLVLTVPSAGFEGFSAEMSQLPPGPPDLDVLDRIGRKHGIEIVLPGAG